MENNKTFTNLFSDDECKDYSIFPQVFPPVWRIIAIGDIHGDFNYLIHLLKIGYLIDNNNEWIGGKTVLIQVGDLIDSCRQYHTFCDQQSATINDQADDKKVIDYLDNLHIQAEKHGGAVISLSGNHEIMNITGDISYVSYQNLKMYDNNIELGKRKRIQEFSKDGSIGRKIICTHPPAIIIGSNLFVHAGILPIVLETLPNLRKILKEELIKILTTMQSIDIISLFRLKLKNKKLNKSLYSNYISDSIIQSILSKKQLNKNELDEYSIKIKNFFENNIEIFELDEIHPIELINTIVRKWLLGKINYKYLETLEPINTIFWNRILGNIPDEKHKNKDYRTCEKYVKPVLKFLNINKMIIGHTPQFSSTQSGINYSCDSSLIKIDIGGSKVFDMFDDVHIKMGKHMKQRIPQVLEILNDVNMRILS